MKKLLAAILVVLIVGAGLIIWQVWDAKATASAQRLTEAQAAVAAGFAEQEHELDNEKYHIAQIIWGTGSRKVSLYKFCLERHVTNDPSVPECIRLDRAVQRAIDRK